MIQYADDVAIYMAITNIALAMRILKEKLEECLVILGESVY